MLALAASVVATTAWAGDETPGLDKRQENQEKRIERGVESGQLNQREAARLEHAEGRLEADEAKAKADGKVTARERRRLHREADVDSARIAKQKHDRQGARINRPNRQKP
ncbi:MAG: hypothetical protein WCE48_07435 [Steroidobacteraceae bacterium]